MNCKEINTNLIAYLENSLSKAVHQAFENHVSACDSCKKMVTNFSKVYNYIDQEKKEYTHNHYLGVKIWNRIETSKHKDVAPMVPFRRFALTSIAAAGLIIGIALGTLLSSLIFTDNNVAADHTWAQLTEEYFPSEVYQPYNELSNNE
jgi:predicted anti-sigma-YlaC factor YlaD